MTYADLERPTIEDVAVWVRPVWGGWAVGWDGLGQDLYFISGARAEAQARRMADCMAEAGADVRIEVRDRHDLTVGSVRVFAKERP